LRAKSESVFHVEKSDHGGGWILWRNIPSSFGLLYGKPGVTFVSGVLVLRFWGLHWFEGFRRLLFGFCSNCQTIQDREDYAALWSFDAQQVVVHE